MNETYFFRLRNGQWFQFTGTRKQGDRLFKTFDAFPQSKIKGWVTGVERFEREYKLKASTVPSIS